MSAPTTTELQVEGMTCNNCARHVTEAIQGVSGVQSASVSLQKKSAAVRWTPDGAQNIPAVLTAISQAGYEAKEVSGDAHDHTHSRSHAQHRWEWNLILGLAVTGLLMIGEWGFQLAMVPWFRWTAFMLAGIVQVFCGAQFYIGAWRQLKVAQSNMDTLVALGSSTAFGYSTWALLSGAGGHLYFMEAAAIISLISAGHWLEARVSDQAGTALQSLLNLAPQKARRMAGAVEEEVLVADLKVEDRVILRPGDRVPVDGVVAEGESAVDEAMLTGESAPVDKKSDKKLFAGTVNLNGRLVMRVTATGEATALAHIIAVVQRAQTSRANIQRLGDQVSNIFVPVMVGVALVAGLWWGFAPESAAHVHDWLAQWLWHAHVPVGTAAGFIIASAVLIVACPCAMGLATPAAIMAAANTAAKRGILIRDGVALEKAGKITAVVFDKTGTLTTGKPVVAAVAVTNAIGDDNANYDEAVKLAAALARGSTHPLSQAIGQASHENVEFFDWQEVRGAGVQAKLPGDDQPVRLGSLRWLKESGVDLAAGETFVNEWSGRGATVVGLAAGDILQGLFAVHDALKNNADAVVKQLSDAGLKVFLVTGDNALTAAGIAKHAGIAAENVFAEVRPEQKGEFVKKLQARGERIAFVGDGINDAPALTQADLGIAVSRASDVAREAADIILLKSEIEAVPEALGLARATLRTIKQNLFWAFFYNALGVPLAALGFVSPIWCAAAMGLSDLIVIGNALRLLRWRIK